MLFRNLKLIRVGQLVYLVNEIDPIKHEISVSLSFQGTSKNAARAYVLAKRTTEFGSSMTLETIMKNGWKMVMHSSTAKEALDE